MQPLNSDTKNRPRIAFITVFFYDLSPQNRGNQPILFE